MRIKIEKGFTLLELLVAISIFSMLSVMAYGGLQAVITTKTSSEKISTRVSEIQLAIMRVSNDLRQTVDRSVRDEHGDVIAAMKLDRGKNKLEWTRAGYRNPAGLKRSNLQRVSYVLEDKTLFRLVWPVLDRAQDTEVMKSEVLTNIENIEWRFYNNESTWITEWPQNEGKEKILSLPNAVEINIDFNDFGKIRRLILLVDNV